MNKYLFIIGLIGTALFTACSTSDDLVAEIPSQGLTEEEKAIIIEAGQDSDVPITIGSVGTRRAMTRTPFDPETGGLFVTPAGKYLGVYCLATGLQEEAPSIGGVVPENDDDILWNNEPTTYEKWMENVPAKVSKQDSGDDPISGATETYSYVAFLDPTALDGGSPTETSKVYYYPFGNWYHYDFFAYYPRQKGSDKVLSAKKFVYVKFEIDGTQDIIWGTASGDGKSITDSHGKNVKAYCSKYIRLMKEVDGEDEGDAPDYTEFEVVPAFTFNHLLTQFVFSIKPHDNDAQKLFDNGFRLTGLTLKNVYKDLGLFVASKTSKYTSGELRVNSDNVIDIPARKTDDSAPDYPIYVAGQKIDESTPVNLSTKEVGYAMVPTSAMISSKTHNQYLVYLTFAQNEGDVPSTVVELTPPAGGFLKGEKYNITIEIFSPTKIQAKATLDSWQDGYDGPDDGVFHVD